MRSEGSRTRRAGDAAGGQQKASGKGGAAGGQQNASGKGGAAGEQQKMPDRWCDRRTVEKNDD